MSDHQFRLGTFVCASCLEDEGLQQFANTRGAIRECDYCRQTPASHSVVSLDDVVELMAKAIGEEWCDPAETSPVDGGEYWLKTIDTEEMFFRIGFEVSNQKLLSDILNQFSDHDWCDVNWQILSPSKRWGYGWERFEHVIKHERRYTFWYNEDDGEDPANPDHLPPSQMLGELQGVINRAKMVRQQSAGTPIWRVRCHERGKAITEASHLSSPPIQLTSHPNRMSPAGVPMFYGAADFQTAVEEIVDPDHDCGKDKVVSGGQFANITPLNILDLTNIPPMPSYFASNGPFDRHVIRFLKKFTAAVAQPIKRDGQPHIEYVPTQVFTEFVRHVMKGPQGIPVHGIKYPSSKNGRDCYVIFADQEDCLESSGYCKRPQILKFIDGSIKTFPLP